MTGCTGKITVALQELPNFRARPGTCQEHHFGQVSTPLTKAEWREHHRTRRVMSVFAQPVPHTFREGDWDTRREDVARVALDSIGRFCSNLPAAVLQLKVMGPRDIERETGLSGGHIFQGGQRGAIGSGQARSQHLVE